MSEYNPTENHILNQKYAYQRRQIRDTIGGPTDVKISNILYLPMPSSFQNLDIEKTPSQVGETFDRFESNKISSTHMPFYHPNPAYRAYLQRARFPDLTSSILIGLIGFASKEQAQIFIPPGLEYLETNIDGASTSLEELFWTGFKEVLQHGKFSFVVDFDESGNFFVLPYCCDLNNNWKYENVGRTKQLTRCSFIQNEDETKIKDYRLKDGSVFYVDYVDSEEGEEIELSYKGKKLTELPVFFAGAVQNKADSFVSPLIGVSDCAIEIYQIHADMRQAEYLTCNPTLFVFGVGESETPKVVGSQVVVGMRNPQARAEYPNTDTSALNHLDKRIENLKKEAIDRGAAFISGGAKESGEALSIKQSAKGTNLIHCINMVSKALNDALQFICDLKGISIEEDIFQPNMEFVESILTSQDITALVGAWVQAAIPHDVVLDNLRDAGYISQEIDNKTLKSMIISEPPAISSDSVKEEETTTEEDK